MTFDCDSYAIPANKIITIEDGAKEFALTDKQLVLLSNNGSNVYFPYILCAGVISDIANILQITYNPQKNVKIFTAKVG